MKSRCRQGRDPLSLIQVLDELRRAVGISSRTEAKRIIAAHFQRNPGAFFEEYNRDKVAHSRKNKRRKART